LPPPPPPGGGGNGPLPHEFFGLVQGGDLDRFDVAQMEATNVATMRVGISWRALQPRPGPVSWPDPFVTLLAEHGIRPVFTVFGAPEWATGSSYIGVPPLDRKGTRAWKKFLSKAAKRYGPHGTFWGAHPRTPKMAVKSWQIWNEPNLAKSFARRKGSEHSIRVVKNAPRAYARLVKSADKAISKVDKHANVILGGLTSNPEQEKLLPWRFLKRFLKVHGIKKHFAAAAVHPYSPTKANFKSVLKRTRRAMRKHGARKKELWLTEVGWGSAADKFSLTKGMEGQAKMLRKSFKVVMRKRHKLNISRVFWFFWRDPRPQQGPRPCTFCTSAGLLKYQRGQKPSYREFRRFAFKQRR
jgi:hypothetical protein